MTFRLASLKHVGVPGLGAPNLLGLSLGGHIGPAVSALVDGQLSPEAEERAWRHVLGCPGCRRLVENEGWTKTRLATLATAPDTREARAESAAPAAPAGLIGALYDVGSWAEVDELERASRRRRAMVALVGAGSIGAAVLGLVAVTTPPAGRGEIPGSPSPAMIRSQISGLSGATGASHRATGPGVTGLSGSGAGAVLGLRADAPTVPGAPASPVSARGTDPQPVGGHASR